MTSASRPPIRWQGLSVLGLVAVAGLYVLGLFVQATAAPDLRGRVAIDGDTLVINNDDTRVWTDLRVRLNHDYTITHDAIRVGQTARIPLARFAASNGRRFSVAETKPLTVYVAADVDSAGTKASAGWRFP